MWVSGMALWMMAAASRPFITGISISISTSCGLNLTGAFNRLPSVRNSLDECIRAKQIAHLSAQILQTQRFVLRDQYL